MIAFDTPMATHISTVASSSRLLVWISRPFSFIVMVTSSDLNVNFWFFLMTFPERHTVVSLPRRFLSCVAQGKQISNKNYFHCSRMKQYDYLYRKQNKGDRFKQSRVKVLNNQSPLFHINLSNRHYQSHHANISRHQQIKERLTRNLTWPNDSVVCNTCGLLMKPTPFWLFGGNSPINAYFMHSIIVVFPLPFWPRINVNGVENWIFCEMKNIHCNLEFPRSFHHAQT